MQEKRGYSGFFFVHRKKERTEKEKLQPNVKQIDKEFKILQVVNTTTASICT